MISRLRFICTAALAAGALAALPAAAGANVQVGSSGWQWGNPQPQGNTIRAMSFGGLRGYAAGDFGTLLQSEDGGTTWSGLPAGTHQNLTEVQAVDADTVVAGGGCVARRSDNGGLTFSRMAFTPVESSCKEGLQALFFPTEKIGYFALADGTVFRTPDGGTEFEQKSAVPGTRAQGGQASPASLWFTSETIGFAASTDGKIFQTKDSGNTWTLVNDTQRAVRDIAFADPTTGYAVGTDGLFLRTTDSGATWTAKASGSSEELTTVRCASLKLCVVTTASGTTLLRTENGGDSFTVVTPATDAIHAAAYASPTRLAAAGAAGTTVVSDDGGANFTPIGGRLVGKFLRIRAGLVPGSAFAPGDGGALGKTVDGGKTWTRGNVSTSEDVLDVSFPTVDEGYALDTAGGLFRTSTGGQSWKTLDTGTTARPNAVLATSAQNVLLVGPTGVRRSTDGGGTFEAVKGKAVSRTPLGAVDRAGSALVAYGSQRIIRSTDAGAHWTELRKPGKYVKRGRTLVNRLRVANVDFVDAKNGFALDGVGRLWKTRNAGRSWSELPGIGTEDAYGMAFSSTKAGYLVIYRFGDINQPSGFLLRTRDGGATWHPQFVVSTPIPAGGIAAPGGGVDYLLGGESALLSSTTGGDFGGESTLTVTTKRRSYKKPVRITVTGKLSPALGNERVTVSYRRPGSTGWASQTVKTAANGAYTTSWNLARGTNTFVAQWQGDFRSHGDGSPVLTVKVARRK
jgi:photosystem II stability/assembly factor-like uncharacterized protein